MIETNTPSGELKKSHLHCIFTWNDLSHHYSCKDLCNKLFTLNQLNGANIQSARNLQNVCRYLTHKDNLEKYQYDDNDVFTNDKDLYEEYITKQEKVGKDEDKLNKILDYVELYLDKGLDITKKDLIQFCRKNFILDYYMKHCTYIDSILSSLFNYVIY